MTSKRAPVDWESLTIGEQLNEHSGTVQCNRTIAGNKQGSQKKSVKQKRRA